MAERLKETPPQVIETESPDNGDVKLIERNANRLLKMINSGILTPEGGVRVIWRKHHKDQLTADQRMMCLDKLIDGLPEEVIEELTKPIGPKGETRLMQIAAEEETRAIPRGKTRERPSRGMRKHRRRMKAEARRKGELPPNF